MTAVEVDHLTIRYGEVTAVEDVTFAAAAGEVTVLLGPNGAGKTSTVECLVGFRAPSDGKVRVEGLDPRRDHAAVTRRIGVMPQEGGVASGARPPEVLRLHHAFYEHPADPDQLLSLVGLDHRRRSSWRTLSGGERQRLSLALALIGRPAVAFLDEPTAGVDLEGRELIRSLISGLRDDGVAVLLTTHDLADAEALADRIVILDTGRVVADGSPADLLSAADAAHFRFRLDGSLDSGALARHLGAPVVEEWAGAYRVDATPTPSIVADLTGWLADRDLLLGDLQAGRQRLDEVFARLTGERSEAERLPEHRPRPGRP